MYKGSGSVYDSNSWNTYYETCGADGYTLRELACTSATSTPTGMRISNVYNNIVAAQRYYDCRNLFGPSAKCITGTNNRGYCCGRFDVPCP